MKERFGSILKAGIKVAGRHYQFLAYSNSGLKQVSDVVLYTYIIMISTDYD